MKALTVPKLELQADVLLSGLREEIFKALTVQIHRTLMWSDSTTDLQWLNSPEMQPIFVVNRVAEILEGTATDQWHQVVTQNGSADAGTRGMSSETLQNSAGLRVPSILQTSGLSLTVDVHWCTFSYVTCTLKIITRVSIIFALIQQKYAVLKLRSVFRSIRFNCVLCKKRNTRPVQPRMADLPSERLAFQNPPFTNVSIEYFGPFYVTIPRTSEKK